MNLGNEMIKTLHNGELDKAKILFKRVQKEGSDQDKFDLAEDLYDLGFVEESSILIDELLELYPGEGELLVMKAEILVEMDQEEKAIELLSTVHEQDPNFPRSLLLLADLYQMQGLYEVSERKLLEAKEKAKDEVIIDFALGELYLEQGKFREAIKTYHYILNEKKEEKIAGVSIHQRIAETLSTSGAFEEALPHYRKAVKEQFEANTIFGYGFTALQAGQHQTAIQQFEDLLSLDPEYYSVYLLLGQAYELDERLEEALETGIKGCKQDSYNKDLLFFTGKIALKLKDDSNAEKYLREALAVDPEFIEAAFVLNRLLLSQEDYNGALEILHQFQDIEDPRFIWDEAKANNGIEKYEEALNAYHRAYIYFKEDQDFLKEYAYFLIEDGKRTEAKPIVMRLRELDPTNEEWQDMLVSLEE
ncbi:hypothetical protein Q75_08580 [Bacillus coahuilensis p1.1.43]|uniref:Tetratricopeptide repeat protein n=1 Tax=Bacillus coahuilensis p1.1.43 TaxID=1150625 RepID=A0A147K8N1_9BACI|nr:tetratricopeptide repeat protein [Bacillus coahuilensis]KUP06566.1 hypothetical protein Q75_08580 [Bacillus coahuilensis p1.1.43]